MEGFVGDVRGVILLDNEGQRIIAKYYNCKATFLETTQNQKSFEKQLFVKSSKQSASGGTKNTNSYENDIMTVDNYVAIFRTYSDMTIFIVGLADDNELILGLVLDCVHECFDRIFKGQIERRSLINNMSGVILVIDELFDHGIIMHLDSNTILSRIKTGKTSSSGALASGTGQSEQSSSSLFSSVFSSARSQLAKTMGM